MHVNVTILVSQFFVRLEMKNMYNTMLGLAQTGDNSKPWLIAICMIISIIVVVALFIIGQKDKSDDEDMDDIEE